MKECITDIDNNYKHMFCPLCKSETIYFYDTIKYPKDLKYSTIEITLSRIPELWKCENCGSYFIQNILKEEDSLLLYLSGDSSQRWDSNSFEEKHMPETINELKKYFLSNKKILDIGCGNGSLLDFASMLQCQTYGIEYSKNCQLILDKKHHIVLQKLDEIENDYVDVITAFDLIEHLYDAPSMLEKYSQKLKNNGTLIILTGNIDSISSRLSKSKWWYLLYPEHIIFPSIKYFKKLRNYILIRQIHTYASKGYSFSLFKIFVFVVKNLVRNSYKGLPPLGPDHHLLILKNNKINCPICNSNKNQLLYELYDDRYGYTDLFCIYQCQNCSHKYLNHNFTAQELKELYTNYYPRSSYNVEDYKPNDFKNNFISWFNGVRRSAFTYVPKNVKVLDIGCGFGESLGYHNKRGCEVYGVEVDANVIKVAEKYGFNIKIGLFNENDYKENFFDYVTMDQVLEHIVDPIVMLRGVSKVLSKNGKLIISTPNSNGWGAWLFGKKWINWHVPYHLHHFSKKSLQLLADKTGFEILTLKTITSSEWLHYQWVHLVFYPKFGEKSLFWSSSLKKVSFFKKLIFKIFVIIHKMRINHLITRFFDILGIGDNYIVILKKNTK